MHNFICPEFLYKFKFVTHIILAPTTNKNTLTNTEQMDGRPYVATGTKLRGETYGTIKGTYEMEIFTVTGNIENSQNINIMYARVNIPEDCTE